MKELQNIILRGLPKMDVEIKGNYEHKEKHGFENQSHVGSMLSQLERKNIESQTIIMNF